MAVTNAMSLNSSAKKRLLLIGRILTLVLLAVAALLSGRSTIHLDPYGLLFVVVGGIAGALVTFSGSEIRAAFVHALGTHGSADEVRRSALFWEAAARNFWILGVLRSILSFVISLATLSGGLAALTAGLADSLLAAVYGMVLAVVCYVPFWKLERRQRRARPQDITADSTYPSLGETSNWTFSNFLGYALFGALLLSTLLHPSVTGIWAALGWIIYWPSLLIVFGGTLALLLFLGDDAHGSAISPGFAVTGMIGSLAGFVQALLGISSGSIEKISSALVFILSSCFAALIGMFLLGGPLEDRAAKGLRNEARPPISRAAWYAFPLLALFFLVVVFLLVVTPFERHQ